MKIIFVTHNNLASAKHTHTHAVFNPIRTLAIYIRLSAFDLRTTGARQHHADFLMQFLYTAGAAERKPGINFR